ncbi:protein phosphatase 1 regulatory subunit 36 isoform X2 [Calliopsis andreniformis]|uniref:protein phosphatase 1 regulatory subunit 36 isoform X2 n=1 Tax=Calliopsis andreniformis TaxID=337506 RepID=UPI003FCD37DB
MEGKHFGWDEITDGLILVGIPKTEDEQIKRHKRQDDPVHDSEIYAPHAYLILNFHETLSERGKLSFRRHFLRTVAPNEPNIIILQDIKDLVLFLLATPVSPQFINFFHLPIVDRFLRATIIYFQYYVAIYEDLMAERAATMKKAPNPLARGYRSRYANEMQNLRCILGREYADLIIGCQDTIQYHHMTGGKKGMSSITQSQGEKDLRMFEVLICMTHRIVWIALERKYFSLIEIELHRLLRTDAYNMAQRRSTSQIVQDMLTDDIEVLQGRKIQEKRKLLRNSALIQELIYSNSDYRLLSLGIGDDTNDARIVFLQNALLIEEDKLLQLGIRIGILGKSRDDYDIMLMPVEKEALDEIQLSERRKFERRSTKDTVVKDTDKSIKTPRLPLFETECELVQDFPIQIKDVSPKGYQTVRQKARKKWLIREIKRQNRRDVDTYSLITME